MITNYSREEDKNKRIMIIVDPQNDFIEGGNLPVDGGKKALNMLIDYFSKNHEIYSKVYVTKDYHPENHCSFKENGGLWNKHCVQGTNGSEIYQPLKMLLDCDELKHRVAYCYKGETQDRDQYSVFDNDESGEPRNLAGKVIKKEIKQMQDEYGEEWVHVFVCGIAGDICVTNTIKDMLSFVKPQQITIFRNFQASIDDGSTIFNLANIKGLNIG